MLRGYRRDWLAGDLLAGVTVAAYLCWSATWPGWP
jgi:hypothetical protein